MASTGRWGLAVAMALTTLTPAANAFAQEPGQADALFNEGRDLLEKGKFAEACPKLARSEELSPAVGTLLNLAYCYEQVGKLKSAIDAYAEAESLANAAGETKRASFARDRAAAVDARTPKLVIRIAPPEAPGPSPGRARACPPPPYRGAPASFGGSPPTAAPSRPAC